MTLFSAATLASPLAQQCDGLCSLAPRNAKLQTQRGDPVRITHSFVSYRGIIQRAAVIVVAVVLSACSDVASPPIAPSVQPSFALLGQGQGRLRMDTPWRVMRDAELASKVTEAGGRVFIGFKDPGPFGGVDERGRVGASAASVAAAKAQLRALGVDIVFEFLDMPTVVARMSAARLSQLRQNPLIEYIEPIFPGARHAQTTTWNVGRVNAPAAWSYSTGSGAKLLIIDSGIENTHPDLAPAVVQSCESPPTNGLDLDGHGTSVAGVAAAVNNNIQIVGVAHGVSLWTSKDGNTVPDPAYTACGVQFGRTNGVHAINISSSMNPYTALTDQINAAYYQNGIVIVVAAGNTYGGAVTYPATLGAAIAVSATDINNNFAWFSAAGSKIELAAPGAGITTTCLGGITCSVNGTSFSAPHVAAAAALLKVYNSSWSNVEIRRRLGAGATDLGPTGRDVQFGYGLLNITGAIAAGAPVTVYLVGPTYISDPGLYRYEAFASGGNGSYTYQWAIQYPGIGGGWGGLGTSQTQDINIAGGEGDIQLRVTVTSAGVTAGDVIFIINAVGCAPAIIC